ncbi:MAG: hypothetical protein K8R77_01920 [Anaerolineaceae bacterium]|nr:hypothetical protein [Anaerolineaceae bacterium]
MLNTTSNAQLEHKSFPLTIVSIVILLIMAKIKEILIAMQRNPKGIAYNDLCKVCDHYFGKARQASGSHRVYKTPWQGDPRVNIQSDKGKAKAYQVRQVLKAINRLEAQK